MPEIFFFRLQHARKLAETVDLEGDSTEGLQKLPTPATRHRDRRDTTRGTRSVDVSEYQRGSWTCGTSDTKGGVRGMTLVHDGRTGVCRYGRNDRADLGW